MTKKEKPAKEPGPTMVDLNKAGDERLLSEFRYAVDHWVVRMSPAARDTAFEYLKSKISTSE